MAEWLIYNICTLTKAKCAALVVWHAAVHWSGRATEPFDWGTNGIISYSHSVLGGNPVDPDERACKMHKSSVAYPRVGRSSRGELRLY